MRKRTGPLYAQSVFYLLALFCAALAAVFRFAVTGLRFGAGLLAAAALVLLVYGILTQLRDHRAARIARRVLTVLLALGFALFATLEYQVLFRAPRAGEQVRPDAVIVLGAGVNGETPSLTLSRRIRCAEEYLRAHPEIPVVLSGGQGPGERITEAEAMRRVLSGAEGLAGRALLLEERSTSTTENLRFSKEILETQGIDLDTAVVAVVTSDFHLYRASLIAAREGVRAVGVGSTLPRGLYYDTLEVNYYIREAFALASLLVFGG